MTKEVSFIHFPRGKGYCARAWPYNENALFLLKSSSLLPGIDKTKWVKINDEIRRVYQIVNFITPFARVIVLGRGHKGHKNKNCIIPLKILLSPAKHVSYKLIVLY